MSSWHCQHLTPGGFTLLWSSDVLWKASRDVALLCFHRVSTHWIKQWIEILSIVIQDDHHVNDHQVPVPGLQEPVGLLPGPGHPRRPLPWGNAWVLPESRTVVFHISGFHCHHHTLRHYQWLFITNVIIIIFIIIMTTIIMPTTMLMMPIAAEMWTSERPGTPGHHAAKDQEGKLAHAGYNGDYHDSQWLSWS